MSHEEEIDQAPERLPESGVDLSWHGWQRRYAESKTGWDRGGPNPMLLKWLDQNELTANSILVPGCGRGHEALRLAQASFEVTAVDFAPSAVEHLTGELKRLGLRAEVMQADLFEFQPERRFDAIYEQTCLCAIDPSRWPAYEQLLSKWLLPNGRLYALFMQSGKYDAPPFSCDLDKMRQLFHASKWQWENEPFAVEHPMGMHELACVLRLKDKDQWTTQDSNL